MMVIFFAIMFVLAFWAAVRGALHVIFGLMNAHEKAQRAREAPSSSR
jgi:hypothetical protein